jgi:molybdopterin synthase catalytic subunit
MTVSIIDGPIDIAAETRSLTRGRSDIGALVTFSGICRSEEDAAPIDALLLEHYPGMAEAEIERHIAEAKSRWPLLDARIVHRVGRIVPGETIVFVAAIATHRHAAFSAAEFLMDYLKTRAPFWKKAQKSSGGHWIEAHEKDDDAAARWEKRGTG